MKLNSFYPFKSGWQDSNLRPPAPKAGAIPGYATPRTGITIINTTVFIPRNYWCSLGLQT
jgi:hypothetical protein